MWMASSIFMVNLLFFFFFQAEDGIRDHCVTGVQTCALPISWLIHCLSMTKQELREKVGTMLEKKGVARFPDAHGRILKSNFQSSARNSPKSLSANFG